MKVEFYDIGTVEDRLLKYAVMGSKHNGRWVYVKHKERDTYEIPGGRREPNENIMDTAKRELFEETGAVKFDLTAVCEYSVERDGVKSYGRLCSAEIHELGELPEMEIEKVELFDCIPGNLTYPKIQPFLHNQLIKK